jgi:Ca2+-binding EF-hand superfamily protein
MQVTHVNFERFVALYTNHRPVFGIGKEQIAAAFDALQLGGGQGGVLDADDLVGALTTEGEPMSQTELEECLNALSGTPIASLYDIIPPQVDAQQFAEQVLGFEPYTVV